MASDELESNHRHPSHSKKVHHQHPNDPIARLPAVRPSPKPSRNNLSKPDRSTTTDGNRQQEGFPLDPKKPSTGLDPSHQLLPSFNLPPSPSLLIKGPISIENRWPPTPYGIENVPTKQTVISTDHYRPATFTSASTHPSSSSYAKDPNDNKNISNKYLRTKEESLKKNHRWTNELQNSENSSNDPSSTSTSFNSRHYVLQQGRHEGEGHTQEPSRKNSNGLNNQLILPPSLTLSLFTHLNDPSLTWVTKLKCFGATLAINLFLPFMNGMMLGFGEIAARELLGNYFGWGPSGYKHRNRTNQEPIIHPNLSSSSSLTSDNANHSKNRSLHQNHHLDPPASPSPSSNFTHY